ncbi:MAG: hypothetical protein II308_09465, partial [Muribaculaceae bacterium]|nr:hypothetical protein [Muribaculaceae bacterium]
TEKSLADVEFVWATADGKTNTPATNFINIPVQRNYRTNIIGKLLTTPSQFNIVVDPIFEGEKKVEVETVITKTVKSATELQAAIDAAVEGRTVINFANDITGGTTIVVNQKKDVEILINGQDYQTTCHFLVNGGSVWGGKEGLSIQNVVFRNMAMLSLSVKEQTTTCLAMLTISSSQIVHSVQSITQAQMLLSALTKQMTSE